MDLEMEGGGWLKRVVGDEEHRDPCPSTCSGSPLAHDPIGPWLAASADIYQSSFDRYSFFIHSVLIILINFSNSGGDK